MSTPKGDCEGAEAASDDGKGPDAMDVESLVQAAAIATGRNDFPDRRSNGNASGYSAPAAKRRMKKDDSGISVDADGDAKMNDEGEDVNHEGTLVDDAVDEKSSDMAFESTPDGKLASASVARVDNDNEGSPSRRIRKTRVRNADSTSEDRSSPDSGHNDGDLSPVDFLRALPSVLPNAEDSTTATTRRRSLLARGSNSMRVDADEEDEGDRSSASLNSTDDEDEGLQRPLPVKVKPKHSWSLYNEISKRQYGISNNYSSDMFRLRAYGSLHMAERLELMYKMKRHEGCVNTLHFNGTGTRLVSGSDDLFVAVWDWAIGETVLMYESGHRSNVFQAKFMPLGNDCHIVSCARDGQVRLAELSTTGVCKGTKRLANHRGPAHKLALEPDNPHLVLSCGEDGVVFDIDLRESKPQRLVVCKEGDRKVPLYTINAHPNNPYEFAIGGKDHFVRVYDKRKITEDDRVLKKYCPHHLLNSELRANVTCLMYNYNGSELLASYNDEDIYTFDTSHSDGADFTHRYQGHRNNATVKGVNYFGPKSQFVVSGSDCGHIYLWEHKSEAIVQFMPGDEGGVVNCLEPHPAIPVLATSGLDDDIKVWVPSCERAPKLTGLRSTMRSNQKERDDERRREPETIDGQMLWFLLHHLRSSARRRAREEGQSVDESSTDSNSDEDSDDSEYMPRTVQCAPS